MGILCASRIINALNTKDSKAGVRHSYFTVSLDKMTTIKVKKKFVVVYVLCSTRTMCSLMVQA